MTAEIILRSFLHNDHSITVPFTGEAFFNATVAAKAFDKLPKDWLRTQETQEYIEALGQIILTEQDQLVIVRQGGNPNEQGTWLHPKLAIQFARWLHPKFAVWCDLQVEEILRGQRQAPAAVGRWSSPGIVDTIDLTKNARNVTIGINDYNQAFMEIIRSYGKLEASQQQTIALQDRYIAALEAHLEGKKRSARP